MLKGDFYMHSIKTNASSYISYLGSFIFNVLDTWTYHIITNNSIPTIITSPYKDIISYNGNEDTNSVIVNIPVSLLRKLSIREDFDTHYSMILNTNNNNLIQKLYFGMICLNWMELRIGVKSSGYSRINYFLDDVLKMVKHVTRKLIIDGNASYCAEVERQILLPLLNYALSDNIVCNDTNSYRTPIYKNLIAAYNGFLMDLIHIQHALISNNERGFKHHGVL
jgi:hypothetical protein